MDETRWRWLGWFAIDASGDGSRRWLDVAVGREVLTARNGNPYRLIRLEDSTPGGTACEVHAAFPRRGRIGARIAIAVPEAGATALCEVVVPVGRGLEPDAPAMRLAVVAVEPVPFGRWIAGSELAPGSVAEAAAA